MCNHLKLQLHGCDGLSSRWLCELLDVGVEVSGRDLCVSTGGGLQKGLMDEDVLVLRLHHIVPLGSHARDVAINVYSLLVLHALQHGINDYEAACTANSSTERNIQILVRLHTNCTKTTLDALHAG